MIRLPAFVVCTLGLSCWLFGDELVVNVKDVDDAVAVYFDYHDGDTSFLHSFARARAEVDGPSQLTADDSALYSAAVATCDRVPQNQLPRMRRCDWSTENIGDNHGKFDPPLTIPLHKDSMLSVLVLVYNKVYTGFLGLPMGGKVSYDISIKQSPSGEIRYKKRQFIRDNTKGVKYYAWLVFRGSAQVQFLESGQRSRRDRPSASESNTRDLIREFLLYYAQPCLNAETGSRVGGKVDRKLR